DVMVALGQGALDFDGALRRFQRAAELHKESITDGFDFRAVKARENLPQQVAMLFEQLQGESVVALRERAVTHHVGEHDGGQFALRSEEHTSELQSRGHLVCRLLLVKKNSYNHNASI